MAKKLKCSVLAALALVLVGCAETAGSDRPGVYNTVGQQVDPKTGVALPGTSSSIGGGGGGGY